MPAAPSSAILQVHALRFAYPGHATLLRGLSFDLPAGITLLDGDTGSGKTTLLRLLAADLRAASGSLTLGGHSLADDAAAYRRGVCWFDPRDPAWDALAPAGLMAAQRKAQPGLDEAAWQRHLAGFDLAPHLAKPLYALSTGSRRKSGLAVALAAGAALTLLDEPTAGLDAASLAYLAQALAEAATAPRHALLLAGCHGLDALPLAGVLTLPGAAVSA